MVRLVLHYVYGCTMCVWLRLTNIQTHAWPNTSVVLCANKCDREDERQVPALVGSRLADKLGNHAACWARNRQLNLYLCLSLLGFLYTHLSHHYRLIHTVTVNALAVGGGFIYRPFTSADVLAD